MTGGYIGGLMHAVRAAREIARIARNAGQRDGGPEALEALAKVLEAEADREETPPLGVVICEACGAPRVRTI